MAAWENIGDTNIWLRKDPTTVCTFQSTGENAIVYNNCDSFWSPGTCGSVPIAVTNYINDSNQTKVINGVTFIRIIQVGISVNPYGSCNLVNNDCNLSEVLTHEIGHAIGLGHSSDFNATMFGAAHFDGRCADVKTDDKQGARQIYPDGTTCP